MLGTFWELVPISAFGTGSVAAWNMELVAAPSACPAIGGAGLAAGAEWENCPGIAKGSKYIQLLGRWSACKCCVLQATNLCWMD